jgi:hypothetical protein
MKLKIALIFFILVSLTMTSACYYLFVKNCQNELRLRFIEEELDKLEIPCPNF